MPEHPLHPDDLEPLDDVRLVGDAQRLYQMGGAEQETARRCLGMVLARNRDMVRAVVAAKVPLQYVDEIEAAVLERFAKKVWKGDPITNPTGLLLRMAQFVRADFHQDRRAPDVSFEEWDKAEADPALDSLAIDAAVEELLAPLNGRQREVICQRILDSRTSAEVAAALDTTPGNIDVILHRALKQMREASA